MDGGLHVHGEEEAPINEEQLTRECDAIKARRINSIVVCGVYSPIDAEKRQEDQVRDIILRNIPDADVVCSHEVANIGFMERENASILNASILKFARRTITGFHTILHRLGLSCGLFLTQNDGTLVDVLQAIRLPIKTFLSGPTNSIAGARYLGLANKDRRSSTIVIDIGGTSTDVGVLLPSGVPRQASAYSMISGIRVNYSMPHLETIGLGGGSIVRKHPVTQVVHVGPDSVGNRLKQEALSFGGNTLTATDIAVASGATQIGNRTLTRTEVDQSLQTETLSSIRKKLSAALDLMKTSADPLPVILVGGGASIAPRDLKGTTEVIRPPYHDVANAIGAAIANVGATVDTIRDTSHIGSAVVIDEVKQEVVQKAIQDGANPESTKIAAIEVMPLQYMSNKMRILMRATGQLSERRSQHSSLDLKFDHSRSEEEPHDDMPDASPPTPIPPKPSETARTYTPTVLRNQSGTPEWHISVTDLTFIATGCYILGCAGGGSPASMLILLRNLLSQGHTMRVISASSLADTATLYWGGDMGSPAVSVERLAGTETVVAFRELMSYLGHNSFDAVVAMEIGGGNGMQPLLVGCSKFFDRPAVDADFMGRAYPTLWQTTLAVHAPGELVPCATASGDGKNLLMTSTANDEIVDRALRAACAEMGCRVGLAARPTTAEKVKSCAVTNSLSLAWRIGRCVALAEEAGELGSVPEKIVEAVGGDTTAKILFGGKITAVEQRLFKGHSYGEITISPLSEEELEITDANAGTGASTIKRGLVKIPFKNENILAEHVADDGSKQYLAMVPDLIAVLDSQSGRAVGVPEYRYGLRVTVIGMTGSPRWTDTEKGLAIGGPRAFGYDVEYRPLGVYVEPRSVLEEFLIDN